jgi:hypothetical protein
MDELDNPYRMYNFDLFEAEDDGWRAINGDDIEKNECPEVGPWVIEKILKKRKCPYCGSILRRSYHKWGVLDGDNCKEWKLVHCSNCAFWQFLAKHGLLGDYFRRCIYWEVYIAKARAFEGVLPDGCNAELAKALRRDLSIWTHIHPLRLEKLVADILSANYKPCHVSHVGGSNDGGVDVLFLDSNDEQWLVQVKRRSRPGGEPVETLRNLLGVMYVEGNLRGIVASTADHFTYRAYELQRRAANLGCIIELIDRAKLDMMLSPLIPKRPWNQLYEEYTKHPWDERCPDGRIVLDLLESRLTTHEKTAKTEIELTKQNVGTSTSTRD